MHKTVLNAMTASMLINTVYAGGDIAPMDPAAEIKLAPKAEETSFIKTVDGYIRAGYQTHGDDASDLALGGKLHIDTNSWNGISVGASFYTTHSVGDHDGAGVPFFDTNNESYDILGEVYLKVEYGNTTFKAGRQEIDTPYAGTDDIGMIPNTFEAYVLTNTDIADTTLTAAYIGKMAGVDAAVLEEFTSTGMDDGIMTLGIAYEGIENLALQGWYYDVKDSAGDRTFTYFDATYGGDVNGMGYELTAQYATQDAFAGDASIFGFGGSIGFESSGITLGAAYNFVDGEAADNGFGGGPLVTSSEHLTLAEAGVDGDAVILTVEWDASVAGMEGLTFSAGYLTLKDTHDVESTELDLVASYAFNDKLSLDVIYSDVEDDIKADTFENTRVFVNYTF